MPFSPNPSLPSRQNVLNLINTYNLRQYNFQQAVLGSPSTVSGTVGFNAAISMSALPNSGFVGSVNFQYNRYDAGQVIGSNFSVDSSVLSGTTIQEILPGLDALMNLGLRIDEVVDGPVDLVNDLSVTIVITNTSELYLPGSSFSVAFSNNAANLVSGTLLGLDSTTIVFGTSSTVLLDITPTTTNVPTTGTFLGLDSTSNVLGLDANTWMDISF